ncbi:atypical L-asparaginase, rhizobium type [Talaromyces proteolyticus]|uniref:Atypical L-asparaginase, rhizobium type n=1 Tax=Talaromyces proteolyticus TaxID=1131652 RepID=A0AAD4KXL3_9EURO|nr:atypical L-asparaginase, rhizobium type [Talaromyces proteolyticus]KAH8701673.1 atypical L-asparaginase, rhizobium type [Talaromyces proteolyticus]
MGKRKDCIITDRNGIIENRHEVHVAVIDSDTGRLLYSVGDPSRITLTRSAAKPAQALAVLETGALEQFGFDEADLALMCASHNSEERHLSRARSMLARVPGAREAHLRCGGHPALLESVNRTWIKNDFVPTAVCNNCSGKHVGMLAGAKAIGAGFEDYHLPTHPIQIRVKSVVRELSGSNSTTCKWGIDGCNLPAPALPLHLMAKLYGAFATAAGIENSKETKPREKALARIFNSMTQYPELVGGEGRFCTTLMEAYEGRLIGKVGAEGCYGVGIRASEDTRRLGASGAIGVAVKIEDGNLGILYSAVAEILEQLAIGTPEMRRKLDKFHKPAVLNTAGVITGHTSHLFTLDSPEQGCFEQGIDGSAVFVGNT